MLFKLSLDLSCHYSGSHKYNTNGIYEIPESGIQLVSGAVQIDLFAVSDKRCENADDPVIRYAVFLAKTVIAQYHIIILADFDDPVKDIPVAVALRVEFYSKQALLLLRLEVHSRTF